MALTMVHLLVADLWTRNHPEYRDVPEYYYGAISPDAIHIRDGDDKSRKDEFHLHNWQSPHPDEVIDYWRGHRSPFDVGYGVHVLTDCQWVPRYKQRLPGMMPGGRLNVDVYYHDTFVTDFALYNKRPRLEEILQMIGRAQTPTDHPLLNDYEFSQWRKAMLEAYRGKCPREGAPQFIDEAYVLSFAEDAIEMIDEVFGRVGQPLGPQLPRQTRCTGQTTV